jgi:hypothetical protein
MYLALEPRPLFYKQFFQLWPNVVFQLDYILRESIIVKIHVHFYLKNFIRKSKKALVALVYVFTPAHKWK